MRSVLPELAAAIHMIPSVTSIRDGTKRVCMPSDPRTPSSAAVCLLRILVQGLRRRLSAAEQRLLPLRELEHWLQPQIPHSLPSDDVPLAEPVVRAGLDARMLLAAQPCASADIH